jgi:hypothetical protein
MADDDSGNRSLADLFEKLKPMVSNPEARAQAEWDAAYEGPAVTANRFFLISTGAYLRISFCEQQAPERPLRYRAAVALTHAEALALANLIKGFLDGAATQSGSSNAP